MPSSRKRLDVFSAGEAARIAKIPYATLDYWARTGLVVPTIAEGKGTGSERRYNFDDLVALRVVRDLRDAGIATQQIRAAVNRLREEGIPNPLSRCQLVCAGGDVYLARNCRKMESVLRKPRQTAFAFLLDVERMVKQTRTEVRAFRKAA